MRNTLFGHVFSSSQARVGGGSLVYCGVLLRAPPGFLHPRLVARTWRLGSPSDETLGNIPMTAHVLGGAVVAEDASRGVVDERMRVFGYRNLSAPPPPCPPTPASIRR